MRLKYPIFAILLILLGFSEISAFTPPEKLTYPPLRFQPPRAEKIVLPNGIVVFVLENHELPIVNLFAMIKGGSFFDPIGKEGLAELTTMVLRIGGTSSRTGEQIDASMERWGMTFEISTKQEEISISFSSLSHHFAQGMEIIADLLQNPAFPQDKIAIALSQKKERLRRLTDDPEQYAFLKFNQVIYRSDPRGRIPTFKSLENITRNDLVMFHRLYFRPTNIFFAITGAVTKEDVINLFKRDFNAWQGSQTKELIPPPPLPPTGIFSLSHKTPQSVIITGRPAPPKKSPDYYPFVVLDFILGSGGFRSRIFQEIRTNQGLAYSAGSFYRARVEHGLFGTYAMTKAGSTGTVLQYFIDLPKNVKNHPITEEEILWAKNSLINRFIHNFDTPEQIVRQELALAFDNLPYEFLSQYPQKIRAVTLNEVNRIVKKYLSSTEVAILVLGNEEDYDRPLTSFGKVENLKAND